VHLGINLHTVRAAYLKLEENNLIVTRHGTGSMVLPFDRMQIAENGSSLLSNTVGVIIPDSANPFYPKIISGISEIAAQHHILLITCDTHESHLAGKEYLDMMIAKKVDGVIIAPYGLQVENYGNDNPCVPNCPIPIVYIDCPNEPGYAVLIDAENAGFKATQHLIDHGHQRIAIITGNTQVSTLYQCFSGYKKALEINGISIEESFISEENFFSNAAGYQSTQKFLSLEKIPTAIFAAGDLYAIGAMRAVFDHGLRVPEDIAIVGYNNIDVSAYIEPKLTTINTPMYEMGVLSMQMLKKLIHNEPVSEQRIILPTELIVRRSCGCSSH